MRLFTATTTAALMIAGAASAQMLSDSVGPDYDYNTFNTGFGETGYYNALDSDGDTMLNQSEYATGLYADIDSDNDSMISEDEFTAGNTRYYGDTYTNAFSDYDLDTSGFIDQTEFRGYYDSGYGEDFTSFDADGDSMLSTEEYSTGMYNYADRDTSATVTIEEEGFFEGWFDGDNIEAEVETVGNVYD